jgi:hypothetical protein
LTAKNACDGGKKSLGGSAAKGEEKKEIIFMNMAIPGSEPPRNKKKNIPAEPSLDSVHELVH